MLSELRSVTPTLRAKRSSRHSIAERRRSVEAIDSESPKDSEALRASESPQAYGDGVTTPERFCGIPIPARGGEAPPGGSRRRGRISLLLLPRGGGSDLPESEVSELYRRLYTAIGQIGQKGPFSGLLDAGKSYGIWGVPPYGGIPKIGHSGHISRPDGHI